MSSNFYTPSVIGSGKYFSEATYFIDTWNSINGSVKECRIWLLVFNNKPIQAGYDQENYWCGGNMNEVVVCVGVNKNKIEWCHPFTWCENDSMKIRIRNSIMNLNDSNLLSCSRIIGQEVFKGFKRKDFEKDFRYLSIELPMYIVLIIFVVVTLVTLGLMFKFITNDVKNHVKNEYPQNKISVGKYSLLRKNNDLKF